MSSKKSSYKVNGMKIGGVEVSMRPTAKIEPENLEPFLPMESDPDYVAPPAVTNSRSKYRKVLTNTKRKRILGSIIKLTTRKDDKTMTEITKPKASKTNKYNAVKSICWLIEAGFRGFVGWVLLANFDKLATTIAAIYALGTAGLIVITHFVRANRR